MSSNAMLGDPSGLPVSAAIDTARHPLDDAAYARSCRADLDSAGALVLPHFLTEAALAQATAESAERAGDAFYADSSHNVYLTDPDPTRPVDHPFNRQVASTKGLIADDQIGPDSPLRAVYDNPRFRSFLCRVLGIEEIHPYDDELSSINVHFAPEGRELGWHFDNSSFAVTVLLQAPETGGEFQYVADVREADAGDMAYERVAAVLDGTEATSTLRFEPGDLVLFRGRNSLHRVTPTEGAVTRMLVVFAFNDRAGVRLSTSALETFYGRTG